MRTPPHQHAPPRPQGIRPSPSLSARRRWLVRALAVACWAAASPCAAQTTSLATENQVKAAYLYKFGGYVEWPTQAFEKADSPFVIGVVAADSFAEVLEQTVAGRNLNGHPMSVQRLKRGEPFNGVHMVFISRTEANALQEALNNLKGQAVLTVTDSERGGHAGSMISFVLEDNKVRFDIAPAPAEQSKLKISARLLNVARKVLGKAAS